MPPAGNDPSPTFGVVIVAAGRGERAGSSEAGPKQYRKLAGRPVIARTVQAFRRWDADIQVVIAIHPDDHALLEAALPEDNRSVTVCEGGLTRQASVLEGLRTLSAFSTPPSHVMIHDAARPFISVGLLDNIQAAIRETPDAGVLPVLPIAETVKAVDDEGFVTGTTPRDRLFRAQTPQVFPLDGILAAHEEAAAVGRGDFTDDSAIYEDAGLPVKTVPGDSANIKLTYATDFEDAERMLRTEIAVPDVRVGHGYDTHQLVAGDAVILCGITIPSDMKLSGHSDADVGFHALTDALLATVGEGDIGTHFPPSDDTWKGASSDRFLSHAAGLVRAANGTITHCDVTLLCEAPRIGPHRDRMRGAIAETLGIELSRVSVKATTNERIGFVGRREGIVALATATAVFAPTTGHGS